MADGFVNPWGGFYQGQQALSNAADFRQRQQQIDRQNALYDRRMAQEDKQMGQADQANEIKLIGIQAETIGRALESVKDEQSHQAYRGFLQQLGQTPLGQNKFFQTIIQRTPVRFDPQAIEQGRMQLNALRQQVAGEGYTLKENDVRFDANNREVARGQQKQGKNIERTVDLGNSVEYIYADGSRETKPKGQSPNVVVMGDRRRVSDEMSLRKEFSAAPEVKNFIEIDSQFKRLEKAMGETQLKANTSEGTIYARNAEEAARIEKERPGLKFTKGGNLVAVDQALITILNKMLDPSSVVRESEYARTPGDLAVLNRIKGKIEKIRTGGAGLTQEDRDAIATMAKNFFLVSKDVYDSQVDYYTDLSNRYGYAPENIVRLGGAKGGEKYNAKPGDAGKYLQKFEDK